MISTNTSRMLRICSSRLFILSMVLETYEKSHTESILWCDICFRSLFASLLVFYGSLTFTFTVEYGIFSMPLKPANSA